MPKSVTDEFVAEIEKPHWYPIRRAYMLDNVDADVEITDKIVKFDRILWQIEQQYQLNQFAASNCTLHLKNENEEFDVDNASNYFVTELNRTQDGYRVPVRIEVGFNLPDGTDEYISLFYGHIVDIDVNAQDDVAIIELQCPSTILKTASTDVIGNDWTGESLYGGNTYCYINDATGGDSGTTIYVDNNPSGNFAAAFPPHGYIKIEDEIIRYGRLLANAFDGCLRGQLGTRHIAHSDDTLITLQLLDGNDTKGKRFQFLNYPISSKSVDNISSSDGNITIIESDSLLGSYATNRYGWVDYENGIMTLGEEPSDSSSIIASYTSTFKNVAYHKLVKELLDGEGFSTALVEDAVLKYCKNISVPSSLGRITHAYDSGILTDLGMFSKVYSLCVNSDDKLYIGIDEYLVSWDGEEYTLEEDLGTNNHMLRMQSDDNDNIYGIMGDYGGSSLRNVVKWNGTTLSTLQSGIAAYYDMSHNLGRGQYRGLSIDTTNNVIWFLYDDSSTIGVAKCNFDGTGLTKYSRSANSNYQMDFVDRGNYIDFFYNTTGATLQYDTLTKSSGIWTANGSVITTAPAISPIDVTYVSNDNKIYLNGIYFNSPDWLGWFFSVTPDSTTTTTLKTYTTDARRGRLTGGTVYDDAAWYIEGDELTDGVNDPATGKLYKAQSDTLSAIGALIYRADRYEYITGTSTVLTSRASDETIFVICSDLTGYDSPHGYVLVQYSPYLTTIVNDANINGMTIWEVLSELATLVNYELGVTGDGDIFWRTRTSTYTYLNGAINGTVTTITVDDTSNFGDGTDPPGLLQIDSEIIGYTGKTSTTFTGCVRGHKGSAAATHTDDTIIRSIAQVMINQAHDKNLKALKKYPNWDEIYNVINVKYGDKEISFNYSMAGESYAGSSEATYGKRVLEIANIFLTNNDGYLAETIGWRYYHHYNTRWSLYELETKWQPQLDLADPISIKQTFRILADYVVAFIKRIEVDMTNFSVRLQLPSRPNIDAPTIYDV
ncbi:MAG: hypothetical protein H8D45_21010 [Bacteroidetes bacterium]|nr:hypothetical protein [Bacteroidota bacterium]